MGLKGVYHTLIERLNLFSSHQIGEESTKFAKNAQLLTVLVMIIGGATFVIDLIPINLPVTYKFSISIAIIGLTGIIAMMAWGQRKLRSLQLLKARSDANRIH